VQIYQTLYASSGSEKFTDQELADLLTYARRRNAKVGLTGMLLYHDGNFIQLLEGPQDAVETTLARICNDRRHKGILTLYKGLVENRLCAEWEMGFQHGKDLGGFEFNWDSINPRLPGESAALIRIMIETFYVNAHGRAGSSILGRS